MNGDLLVALTIGLPPLAGALCYAIDSGAARRLIISLTALVLVGSSILLFQGGAFEPKPPIAFESVVLVLDLALLLYFLYAGIRNRSPLVIGLAALQLIPIAYFELAMGGTTVEPLMLVTDLSIVMALIIGIVGSLVVVYALSYMDEHEEHLHLEKSKQPRFFFFMLLLLGAMYGLVFSNSLYWMYFFWEVTTLCSYELIRHDGTEVATGNAVTALWMNLVGGVAFVAAIFVGEVSLGTLSVQDLLASGPAPVVLLILAALAFAAFTKSAQFPFNKWLQGAMVAPTPVSALLHSSTMVNAGIYLILRIAPGFAGTALSYGVALVGAFTFMVTAVLALNERTSKGILAYSTIGNLGLIILCAGVNTPLSMVAAMTLLVFHSISKGLLFLGAGIVENRVYTRLIEEWEGLLGRFPVTSAIMVVGMLSMFLPPFGMLIGKWIALDAITSSSLFGGLVVLVFVLVGSAATSVYYAKWLGHLLVLPQAERKYALEELPTPYRVSLYTLLGLAIVMGAGVGLVVGYLVLPALPPLYLANVGGSTLNLTTGVGSFITYPYWVAAATIFLIGYFIAKSKGGIIKAPYVNGENVLGDAESFRTTADTEAKIELSGMFLDTEFSSDQVWRLGILVSSLLVLVMFLTVVL